MVQSIFILLIVLQISVLYKQEEKEEEKVFVKEEDATPQENINIVFIEVHTYTIPSLFPKLNTL